MVRLLPSLTLVLALAGCDFVRCENRVFNAVRSPDGRHAAVMFQRDCGATTGLSTQVSLSPDESTPDDSGNLLILGDETRISAQWLGPNQLLITYGRGAQVFRQVAGRDGVRILYRRQQGTGRTTSSNRSGGSWNPGPRDSRAS